MGNVGYNKAFSSGTGIYRTTDGGVTWFNTTGAFGTGDSWSDVVVDPNNPLTVYAAGGAYYGASLNGIYKSTNQGLTWSKVYSNNNAPTTLGRISLAVAPSNSNVVYATISSPSNSGLFQMLRSDNAGGTWNNLTAGTPNFMGGQGWYDQWLAVSPTNSAVVFAAGVVNYNFNTNGVIESTNSGVNWSSIAGGTGAVASEPHTDHHAVAFDAAGKLLDGNDGGLWKLNNATIGSIQWLNLNGAAGAGSLDTIQFEGVNQSPTSPGIVLGGSQDNGTERFTDAYGWSERDGGDGGQVRFSPTNGNLVYRVSPIGSFGASNYFRKSTNAGLNWSGATSGLPSSGPDDREPIPLPGDDGIDSTNFYAYFTIDPNNDQRLILASSDLYITTNGATSWSNLTSGKPGWTNPSNHPGDAVAISNTNGGNTIYAATGGYFAGSSTIYVSTDGGNSWTTRNLPGGNGRVSEIQIDPTNDQIAYAVVSTFGGGHVFRTTNGGSTWTNISGNLPNLPTWTIRIDTNQANTLYVGTDSGVYATTNLGSTWAPLSTALPNVQVLDLDFNAARRTLLVGTHGRGAFEVLTQALTVTNVTSSNADGSYGVNKTITIGVTFSGPVTVTGTPTLALNSGGTASYSGGTGTNTLTFSYTVAAGENSAHLDYSSSSALSGTIKDGNGNFASNVLPAPGTGGSLGSTRTSSSTPWRRWCCPTVSCSGRRVTT
jgi:hypothetical protein